MSNIFRPFSRIEWVFVIASSCCRQEILFTLFVNIYRTSLQMAHIQSTNSIEMLRSLDCSIFFIGYKKLVIY